MLELGRNSTWYGKLETSTKSVLVIFDPKLPQAPTGQIYLFNTERGAVVRYVWSVVSEHLQDLSAEEQQAAQEQLAKDWKVARRCFLKTNPHPLISKVRPAKVVATPVSQQDEDEDELDMEDSEMDSIEFDEEE